MSAVLDRTQVAAAPVPRAEASPFDLADDAAYRHWRARKLATQAHSVRALLVPVADPAALSDAEREALLQRCALHNMAIYQGPARAAGPALPRALGRQLGLARLDANWLADEDGISHIRVSNRSDGQGGFIPYTDRAIRWHTDGYYHPEARCIRAMVLHCVQPAARGGENALLDHELAYIALRDHDKACVAALMAENAMTIPPRCDEQGVARAAQGGPVFSVDAAGGALHMRYTARTRSIEWQPDEATRAAVDFLARYLESDHAPVLRATLQPGMGLVANNVLHDRSAFHDDPAAPRLLYRARYLDRVARPGGPAPEPCPAC
jgi:alpha-ketoglutarate-dependent taurine dioxygenase